MLLVPPHCKISQKSGGIISSTLKSLTSWPTAYVIFSNYPPPPASLHPKLSEPSQVILTLPPPPNVFYRPESPPLCSSSPLLPIFSSSSAPPPWCTLPWPSACHWAPSMWLTCHTWSSAGGGCSPPPGSLPCPEHGVSRILPWVKCGSSPSLGRLPLGMRCRVPPMGTRSSTSRPHPGGGVGEVTSDPPGPTHDGLVCGPSVIPPPGPRFIQGSRIFGGACCFLLLRIIYEYYEAWSAISLFQMY